MASIIFIGIIIFSLALAIGSKGKGKGMGDYLVGGRSFGVFILFFLAVGEIYGIGALIGFPGGIYAKGASYGIWFLAYILLAYPVGYFIAPLMWRAGKKYNAMTAPDLFKSHFKSEVLEKLVGISCFIFLIPWGQLQLEGLRVALDALGYELSPSVSVFIAGGIAYIYVAISGIRAPAVISILKDILFFVAIVIVGWAAYVKMGGVNSLFSEARAHGASISFGNGSEVAFSISTIFYQSAVFYTVPMIVSAMFTSKGEGAIKKAQRFMPLYMLMYPFLIATAYFALVNLPAIASPNHAFIATARELLPAWVLGLVAGGAALSGLLVLAVTSLTVGAIFIRNIVPNIKEDKQKKYLQIVVIAYLLASIMLTISFPSLMLDLVNTAYFGFGQILPGLFAILFFRKATATGVGVGLVVGTGVALFLYFTDVRILSMNTGLIAVICNFIALALFSALTFKEENILSPIALERT